MRPDSLPQPLDNDSSNAILELNIQTTYRDSPMPPVISTRLTQSVAQLTTNPHDDELRWRKLAREQTNPENIQDLAQFLRNTQPPVIVDPSRPKTLRPGSSSRWSMQAFLNTQSKKAKRRKSAPLRVTTDVIGKPHDFVHVSIGERPALVDRQSFSAFSSASKQKLHISLPPPPIFVEPAWPERRSSMENLRSQKGPGSESPVPISPRDTSGKQSRLSMLSTPSVPDRLSQLSYLKDYGDVLRFLDSGSPTENVEITNRPSWKTVEQPKIQSHTTRTPSPVTPPVETSTAIEPLWEGNKALESPHKDSTFATPPIIPPRTASRFMTSYVEESRPHPESTRKPSIVLRTFPPQPKVPKINHVSFCDEITKFPVTTVSAETKKARRPSKLKLVKSASCLDVPKRSPLPESPGLPAMLASMTFPSPPESRASRAFGRHTSSPTSTLPTPLTTPLSAPISEQPLGTSAFEASGVSESLRPALRSYQSDNGLESLYARNRDGGHAWPFKAANTNVSSDVEPLGTSACEIDVDRDDTPKESESYASVGEAGPEAGPDHWKDASSVPDDSLNIIPRAEETGFESRDVEMHRSEIDNRLPREEPTEPLNLADDMNLDESKLVLKQCLGRSITSETTKRANCEKIDIGSMPNLRQKPPKPIQNLAERRMARKTKLKEMLTKETKPSAHGLKLSKPITSLSDAVDSPVLGWFSQNVPEIPKCSPLSHWRSSLAETPISTDVEISEETEPHAHQKASSVKLSPIQIQSPGKTYSSKDSPESRTYHSARSSESSLCSFKTASMHTSWEKGEGIGNARDDFDHPSDAPVASIEAASAPKPERAQAEGLTNDLSTMPIAPELTLSSIMTVVSLSNYSPSEARSSQSARATSPPSPSPLPSISRQGSSSIRTKRGSTLRPLSLLIQSPLPVTSSPAASLKRQESVRADGKPLLRHRPIPIRVAKSLAESPTQHIPEAGRENLPNLLTPPTSPKPRSKSSRMSVPPLVCGGIPEQPMVEEAPSLASSRSRSQPMSIEEENEFLQAHQRETARAWRLAALKERIRLGKATMETELEALNSPKLKDDKEKKEDTESSERSSLGSSGQDESDDTTNDSQPESPAPEIRPKSTKRSTYSQGLNPPLPKNKHTRSPAIGCREDLQLDAAKSSDEWMGAIMPLLENMNRMLREMKEDDIGQELGRKMKHLSAAIADISKEQQDTGY